ncbi:hypothetical protein CO615_08780 [Lysobacteraceae bacterium NML75-0749]|nr:hypothetical protein CO615_08780 [Xanthomonadaceae bacterium NML75-0749]PJK05618.1 hypothetical protein CO609_01250 [Xanthomonadaceae bacterium NML91-0268]
MSFAALLLMFLPMLLLAAVSIAWRRLTLARRVFCFALLPAAGYFGIVCWIAHGIYGGSPPAAGMPLLSPLEIAIRIGGTALAGGVIAVSLAHLIARKGRMTSSSTFTD